MKITIIREDNAVYKDGVSFVGLDLSSAPVNVHALQWNNSAGWIEFVDNPDGTKPQNQPITELPDWAITACAKWDEAKTIYDAAVVAAEAAATQPQTQGTQPA